MSSRVVIPQLELEQNDNPVRKVVEKGAKQVSSQSVDATSFSNDGCTFSFQPPSQNTVLDRRIDLVVPLQLVSTKVFSNDSINGGAGALSASLNNFGFKSITHKEPITIAAVAGAPRTKDEVTSSNNFSYGNNLAPRQLPLASIISNIDITINGTHFTTDINGYVHALMKYTTPEYREQVLHSSYHHPDTLQGNYQKGLIDNANEGYCNPLAIEENGGRRGETPRGVYCSSIGSDANSVVKGDVGANNNNNMVFTCIEPLLISPLAMNYGKGMTNINNIEITLRFRSDLKMAFSYYAGVVAPGAGLALPGVAVGSLIGPADLSVQVQRPTIRIRNFTPQDDIRIPNEVILDYQQPRRFTTIHTAAAPVNTNFIVQTNNRRLDQIPECVYLWIRRKLTDEDILNSNGTCDISNVNITFGNQVGILSGHSRQQLQALAVENGLDLINEQEARRGGLVLKLVFGKDIPLMNNESPGTRGDYNINVAVTGIHNDSSVIAASALELCELYINNGQVIVSPNECRVQTGLLDMKDNIEAEDMGHSYTQNPDIEGGSIFSSVGNFFKKIPHMVVQGVKHLPQALDTADKIAGFASKVAPMVGGSEVGGSEVGGSMVGGSVVGGNKSYHSRRRK